MSENLHLENAGLDPSVLEKIKAQANAYAQLVEGIEPGDLIPLYLDGVLFTVAYDPSATMVESCSSAHCDSVSAEIKAICEANHWPAGHLVLVCDPSTGQCCNCQCGASSETQTRYRHLVNSGLEASAIKKITEQASHVAMNVEGIEAGDLIPVMVEDQLYLTEFDPLNSTTPDCTQPTCTENQSAINQVCKSEGWPPGKPVLVCNTDGTCCNCYCK